MADFTCKSVLGSSSMITIHLPYANPNTFDHKTFTSSSNQCVNAAIYTHHRSQLCRHMDNNFPGASKGLLGKGIVLTPDIMSDDNLVVEKVNIQLKITKHIRVLLRQNTTKAKDQFKSQKKNMQSLLKASILTVFVLGPFPIYL